MIHYVSPLVCFSASPFSGSSSSIASVLDFEPVFRVAGPVLAVSPFSAGKLRLSWTAVPDGFVYVVYHSQSEAGPFTVLASGIQSLFFVDTPANSSTYYQVTAIEPDHGETFPSNTVLGTV